ncbi:hypothetical protein BJ165DRAFT_343510 [Panaeolus papilionaceus]|nr:hypothetical protein BJ165DRAFT_343510 [Panaeolus papilionaceus]
MVPTEVKILEPASYNLDVLADSTIAAFDELLPWCKLTHSHETFQQVIFQVDKYVRALNYSIAAAKYGYTAAGEAISIARLLGYGNESETKDYIIRMLRIAEKGHQNAKNAHECFRGVRTTLGKVITDAKERERAGSFRSAISGSAASRLRRLQELEDAIPVLEQFALSVSAYASWWNFMEMAGFAMGERTPRPEDGELVFNPDSLRIISVVQRWESIERGYVAYTDKITALQDHYPDLLRRNEDPSPTSEYGTNTGYSGSRPYTEGYSYERRSVFQQQHGLGEHTRATRDPETISRTVQGFFRRVFRTRDEPDNSRTSPVNYSF